jgi:hypothetical protein
VPLNRQRKRNHCLCAKQKEESFTLTVPSQFRICTQCPASDRKTTFLAPKISYYSEISQYPKISFEFGTLIPQLKSKLELVCALNQPPTLFPKIFSCRLQRRVILSYHASKLMNSSTAVYCIIQLCKYEAFYERNHQQRSH